MEIRALRESDDRSEFRSGDPDLDRFFQKFAGQNQFRHSSSATYVAVEGFHIVGYATVAPGHIDIEDLPAVLRKKLPRYPLPILRLGRLAVDESFQRQGLGTRLLGFVMILALRMAGDYGCIGVLVDAKPEAVSYYRRFGFLDLEVTGGHSPSKPQPKAMVLPLSDIAMATTKD